MIGKSEGALRDEAWPLMLFIVDFDGTVVPTDTVDALLERFADPEWRRIEEQWVRGEIDSRQCMAAQIALVRGDEDELNDFLCSAAVDPGFHDFIRYVEPFAEIAIVSDGLDYPIRHVLHRLGLSLPIYANELAFRRGGLAISFPHGNAACSVGSGVCKCAITRSIDGGRGLPSVLIGDGRSDFCIAREADFVFAKGTLRRFCEAENIKFSPFDHFGDVLATVQEWKPGIFERVAPERECPLPSG